MVAFNSGKSCVELVGVSVAYITAVQYVTFMTGVSVLLKLEIRCLSTLQQQTFKAGALLVHIPVSYTHLDVYKRQVYHSDCLSC